jgi:alcohol dehydrogenase (cytochrome c)
MKFLFSLFITTAAFAQLNSQALLKPPADSWPTFNGDYSGKRFSPLKQIDATNVHNLALSWSTRFTFGGGGRGLSIKSTPLLVNGILYFTAPNNVWAADARTGHELWQRISTQHRLDHRQPRRRHVRQLAVL